MPKCTDAKIDFGRFGRRVIEADFSGGDLSSDGGLLLVRQVDAHLGLSRAAAAAIPPPRADHAVPPGAAARGQLHRAHRGQHWRRAAPLHQGRVRRLPRMRHPGPWLPEAALRRVRPRQAAGLQLQAAGVLPVMRCAPDVADGSALGGPCHPPCAGAAMGAVTADPAARTAGRSARAGDASAAGGAAGDHAPPAGHRRAARRQRPGRRRHADPALWLGRQPRRRSQTDLVPGP
jgi:hypothetical protein